MPARPWTRRPTRCPRTRRRSRPSSRRTAGCWPPSTAGRSARCCSSAARAFFLRRFGVVPDAQGHGVASAAGRGRRRRGARRRGRRRPGPGGAARVDRVLEAARLRAMAGRVARRTSSCAARCRRRTTPRTPTPCATWAPGWARALRAGDLVILTGDLGAGKTTLTQGIGAGLRRARRGHLADVRDRPGAPVPGRGPGPGARRRLPARRHRRARRPRPRHRRWTTRSPSSSGARAGGGSRRASGSSVRLHAWPTRLGRRRPRRVG